MTDGLEPREKEIGIQRVEALTDGVFAIAMTILVLDLKIPPEVREAAPDLLSALWAQSDKFVCYFWGFLLLGAFWITHVRKFRVLRGSDASHIWLNLLILIFVCLVPFSTSLLGEDSSNSVAQAVFRREPVSGGRVVLRFVALREPGQAVDPRVRVPRAHQVHLPALSRDSPDIPGGSGLCLCHPFLEHYCIYCHSGGLRATQAEQETVAAPSSRAPTQGLTPKVVLGYTSP